VQTDRKPTQSYSANLSNTTFHLSRPLTPQRKREREFRRAQAATAAKAAAAPAAPNVLSRPLTAALSNDTRLPNVWAVNGKLSVYCAPASAGGAAPANCSDFRTVKGALSFRLGDYNGQSDGCV
jgi:hypothetical protein